MKPLENITVIDFSSNLPGPLCSSILIQLGARVIKIESPDEDPFRHSGEMWTSLNLGKESDVDEFLKRMILNPNR